ncbi:MAG: hypothetical protein II610_09440 [Treponema sp.]|nr:hypothetical protein [Treponema sp.]
MKNMTIKEIVTQTLDQIEKTLALGKQGLSLGSDDIPSFQKGQVCALDTELFGGKASLALNWIFDFAQEQGQTCGLFTCGASNNADVGIRILAQASGVSFYAIKSGMMNIENFRALDAAAKKLYNAPIIINDASNISFEQLAICAKDMVQEKKAQIIFIEDFDSILSETPRENLMNELEALAKKLDIQIVVFKVALSLNDSRLC